MERKKSMNRIVKWAYLSVIILITTIIFSKASIAANSENTDSLVMQAFLSGNMEDWQSAVSLMEKSYKEQSNDTLLLHYTLAEYGMTGYLIGNDFEDQGKVHLKKCRELSEKLVESSFKKEAYAIKAGLYGYEIGLKPFKAPSYGKKNQNNIEKSFSISSDNPLAWMEKGNAYYHMPGLFGGSYEKAINYYSKALELFNDNDVYPDWIKTNTRIWLGKAYAGNGDEEKARTVYHQILEKFPGFDWVKKDLLPEVE